MQQQEIGKISPSDHHWIGGEEFARGQVAGIPTALAGDGLDLAVRQSDHQQGAVQSMTTISPFRQLIDVDSMIVSTLKSVVGFSWIFYIGMVSICVLISPFVLLNSSHPKKKDLFGRQTRHVLTALNVGQLMFVTC